MTILRHKEQGTVWWLARETPTHLLLTDVHSMQMLEIPRSELFRYEEHATVDAALAAVDEASKQTSYEAIEVIQAWGLGFCLGNVVKYIARAGKKDPSKFLEDLKKARWYLDLFIQQQEKQAAEFSDEKGET